MWKFLDRLLPSKQCGDYWQHCYHSVGLGWEKINFEVEGCKKGIDRECYTQECCRCGKKKYTPIYEDCGGYA